MKITRHYHGDDEHLDKIEFFPELSCDEDFHTAAEVDFADAKLFTQAPKMYSFLTEHLNAK